MQIAIDLSTRSVLTWTGEPITALSMTCRDRFPVDLRFISNGRFVELPEGAAGKLSMKVPGAWAGSPRAIGESWVKSGVTKSVIYRFFLRLDTVELLALFSDEPGSVSLAMEIEWVYDTPSSPVTVRQTSKPVPVVVSNDYIRETDGLPVTALDLKATKAEAEAGESNVKWMTPLRTNEAIAAYIGDGGVDDAIEEVISDLTATEEEAAAGVDDGLLMTPLRTKQAIETFVGSGGDGGAGALVIDAGSY